MDIKIPNTDKKRVVIIGGGFGGLALADKLCNGEFQVVLLDKHNYHQFQPLLYQVASAGLEPSSISFPFRKNFRKKRNFYFRMAQVKSVLFENNEVETNSGNVKYDYLVIAAGTTTNFFGNETLRQASLPMKSVEEALTLRNTLLLHLERAMDTTDPQERKALLNVVIVGGGATGVEIAGAISEMRKYIIPKDYPDLGDDEFNIHLVEGSHRLLAAMSEEASANALKYLTDMGVEITLERHVENYENGCAVLSDGRTIPTKTLIWVSGVTAEHFENIPSESIGRGGRLIVDKINLLKGTQNVFVIGDIALQTEANYPKGHPQVAPVAIQQGELLADNLKRMLKGQSPIAFEYVNKGTLATIGRNKGVADLKKLRLSGFFAWMVWLLVHLRSILGVKNKLMILINWIWNYLTYDQSVRFIFRSRPKED